MQLRGFLDQVGGDVRTGFFAGVEQKGDLRVILEVEVLQDFQRIDTGNDAALVIHHPRPVRPAILDVKRPLGSGTLLEHRVHVRHQQDFRLAGALEGGENVVGFSGVLGTRSMVAPSFFNSSMAISLTCFRPGS